jgi:hypothetical protein
VDELRQQRSGKGHEAKGAQESDVNPGEIAVGARKMIELRLPADREDAQGHHAHRENDQARRRREKQVPEIVLEVRRVAYRQVQIEHQERHGCGEDAITERSQALDTLSGNTIIERWHQKILAGRASVGKNRARAWFQTSQVQWEPASAPHQRRTF